MGDKRFSAEEIATMRRLHAAGIPLREIAQRFGCGRNAIRRRIDPRWTPRQARRRVQKTPIKPAGTLRYVRPEPRVSEEEFLRAAALIPPDTRDLTARLFGDPLPGRDALSLKLQACA